MRVRVHASVRVRASMHTCAMSLSDVLAASLVQLYYLFGILDCRPKEQPSVQRKTERKRERKRTESGKRGLMRRRAEESEE